MKNLVLGECSRDQRDTRDRGALRVWAVRGLFVLCALLGNIASAAPDKVKLILNWFPEMEHGGYYAALEEGYYREAGVDVEIVPGGPDVPVVPRVATEPNTFGVANADQIVFGREQGAKVVSVFAAMQTSPRCILVHEESGITSLDKLSDVTLSASPSDAFSAFLRAHYKLDGVQMVPFSGNIAPFLADKKYAQQAYNISEPFLAAKAGAKPKVLMLSDAGWNPYTSLLLVSDKLRASNPDLVKRLTQASARGWETYLKTSQKTNEAIHKLNPEMSLEILQFGVDELQTMVVTEETKSLGTGVQTDARWNKLVADMKSLKLTSGKVTAKECFTNEFLAKPAEAKKSDAH